MGRESISRMKKRYLVIISLLVVLLALPIYIVTDKCTRLELRETIRFYFVNKELGETFKRKVKSHQPPEWMLEQVKDDLKVFAQPGITKQNLQDVFNQEKTAGEDWHLVRYQIQNNRIKVVCHSPSVTLDPRFYYMTHAFKVLSQNVRLPDLDFIVSLADRLDGISLAAPVFAFAKHSTSDTIALIPDFEALGGNFRFLKEVRKGITLYPWESKENKAFWRGSMTGDLGAFRGEYTLDNFLEYPRSRSVTLSLKYPQLIDSRFSGVSQCKNPEKIREKFSTYFGNSLSLTDHLRYKYQLLIDGNSCAYSGAYWRLFSNCLTLKQESPHIQWYYKIFYPNKHYIPVSADLMNLPEKVEWAINHDKESQEIVQNAQNLAADVFSLSHVYYYLFLLLEEYSKLLR